VRTSLCGVTELALRAVCVLLTFLSEADTYLVAHLMLEQSRSNRW
jgi:hypothetical protein